MTRKMLRGTVAVASLALLALAACGSSHGSSNPNKQLTIGFAIPVLANPYWKANADFATKMGQQLGVKVIVADAQEKEDAQLKNVQDLIAQGVDGIIFGPITTEIGPALLKACQNAHIMCAAAARKPGVEPSASTGGYYAGYVIGDDYGDGVVGAQLLAGAGCKRVVTMSGLQGNSVADDRLNGFISKAHELGVQILGNPQRPVDGGTFKTLEVTAPAGSIFMAEEPAACQWYFSSLGLLIDLVVTALAPVLPDQVAAAHFGDSMVLFLSGKDPRRGDQPFLYVMPHAGGWGGFEGGDGEDGLINNVNGGFKDYPVEVFEVKYPALIRSYGFRPDTGGAGRFRGGCGLYRVFEVEPAAYLYLWFERSKTPGWGLFGGESAVGPDVSVNPGREDERHMLKVNAHPLAPGSVVDMRTGGGGGFGNPHERDPERVREDVRDGFVSLGGAARDYGVVLDPDTLDVVELRR